MQDKTSNHAPIPTELNIAPRGKSWLHGQLIDGEQGHPTRQSMESADRAQAIEAAPAQAAPAAVAVPDGWKLVPVDPTEQMEQAAADYLGECVKAWGLWKALISSAPECAELAATPAAVEAPATERMMELVDAWFGQMKSGNVISQGMARQRIVMFVDALAATPAAAAPVVLPEPAATIYTMEALVPGGTVKHHAEVHKALPAGTKLFAEPEVRALLAGVSAPAAQAIPLKLIKAINTAFGSNEWQGDAVVTNLMEPACRAIASLSPQAQADARDALAWLEEFTCDLRCVSTSEDDYAWNVIEHHMAEPRERVIGWGQTAIAALRDAQAAQQGDAT